MNRLVECHSGFEYPQKPTAFYWDGKRYTIKRIISEKKTPKGKSFLTLTEEDWVFELIYSDENSIWEIKQP